MSTPLMLLMTDDHLADVSAELSISIHRQARAKAKELGFDVIHHTGDIIDSRKSQSWTVLKTMITILREYEEDDIKLRIIPGNHSKPDYDSEESFLDVFERYPAMELIRDYGRFLLKNDTVVHMVPFFDEHTTYPHYLKRAVEGIAESAQNVLLTHVGVNGVRRNDGSDVENGLKSNVFNLFDIVFIGHFHDYQEVGNCVYYGATHQHNFGEGEDKGLTVVYEDLTFEQFPLDVPKYITHKIDVNKVTDEELEEAIDLDSKYDYHKVKFTGTKDKLASIETKIKSLKRGGVKVESVSNDPVVDVSYEELVTFKGFDRESILEEWESFCDKREFDPEIRKEMAEQLKNTI